MGIERLLVLMQRLRDPQTGCPWDREQSFATIAPYTIEEAYEVADAIQKQNLPALRDELGDLLFQVVFHAQMAKEGGAFDFDAVVDAICNKMERRHPHIFGDAKIESAAAQTTAWEAHKKAERDRQGGNVLDGVPVALPALTRASKLGKRAAQVGFDWPDVHGALEKLGEETQELQRAIDAANDREHIEDEVGDVLFCVTNVCRYLQIDPEEALRRANAKFERRFGYVERQLKAQGRKPEEATLDEMEALWQEGKNAFSVGSERQS
ncbi:MAG: nucleoside triphosphate pyrophosphohydrolase [Steroidobacteraceae bacterium]